MRVLIANICLGVIFLLALNVIRKHYVKNKDIIKEKGFFKVPSENTSGWLAPSYIISSIGVLCFALLIFDSGSNKSNGSGSCDYASNIKDVKSCIVGNWIATPTGEVWNKVVIKSNGTYELYSATPSRGTWGNSPKKIGEYNIGERRYSDTGKKYVYVNLNNSGLCRYQIVFDGHGASLVCNGNYDVIRKGNKNPW